jgi:predicted lipoprotein with Yx(FWY)xxD motif
MVRCRFSLHLLVLALVVAGGALLLRPAQAQSPAFLSITQDATLGPILTDAAGMTLYAFSPDAPGTSACNGGCASTWPPLAPPADGSDITVDPDATGTVDAFARADGSLQVEYNGMPLYYFSGDMNPGDTNGNGIAGKWSVVTP